MLLSDRTRRGVLRAINLKKKQTKKTVVYLWVCQLTRVVLKKRSYTREGGGDIKYVKFRPRRLIGNSYLGSSGG